MCVYICICDGIFIHSAAFGASITELNFLFSSALSTSLALCIKVAKEFIYTFL